MTSLPLDLILHINNFLNSQDLKIFSDTLNNNSLYVNEYKNVKKIKPAFNYCLDDCILFLYYNDKISDNSDIQYLSDTSEVLLLYKDYICDIPKCYLNTFFNIFTPSHI